MDRLIMNFQLFYGVKQEVLLTEEKDPMIITGRRVLVYLLTRKCNLTEPEVIDLLGFPEKCCVQRIHDQLIKWHREDLWESVRVSTSP
jgi:hypothetical protein